MTTIRLIRAVPAPTGRGPGNGQYALQRALRRYAPGWLKIGGPLAPGEIPWFWCWLDRDAAAACAQTQRPFVAGPNILFAQSRAPCRIEAEREICNAASCRLLFTESEWYRRLIECHRGPANRVPIVLWPYPIDPRPGGPLPPQLDLLIYEKSGMGAAARRWPGCCGPGRGMPASATAATAGSNCGRWPGGRAAASTYPTTIAGRWPWPRFCSAAVRRWGSPGGRRSSSRATAAFRWRVSIRNSVWRPWPAAGSSIVAW